jgi:deoxyribose-phosphate aldolase
VPSAKVRNPGQSLDLDWALAARVNRSAVERRAATLGPRRAVKQAAQAAWLLRAVQLIDLTTLAGDDTAGRVRRLCGKARQPVRPDVLEALGMADLPLRVGAVCVYHDQIATAVSALAGSGVPVCAVSTGFPAGQIPFRLRLEQVRASVDAGANEIDIVIHRPHALTGNWMALYDEVAAFKEACGEASMKAILATGELATLRQVAAASRVCLQAGADFIKTSTGKEKVNATLPVGLVMVRALRDYQERSGVACGFKPAGGISTAKDALAWMRLLREELGTQWLQPGRLRFGASSLLADIERQLEHHATGRYSSHRRHPMG